MTTQSNPTQEKPKSRVDLAKRYETEIRSWNWDYIADVTRENLTIEDGSLMGCSFLGSVFNVYPSGKYYMPWCTNQSSFDMTRDKLFQEILESVAEDYNLFISGGEGDPCDIFAFQNFGEDFLVVSQEADESVATDSFGEEIFRADTETFDTEFLSFMERDGFSPDLVTVSDHGNVSFYLL